MTKPKTPATPAPAAPTAVALPEPVARRGITEAAWRTLCNSLYPGAKSESVIMVWDYCVARKLDPLKKPCHIVPMRVKGKDGEYEWRDVVMPGVYELRTTAMRTGLYLGHEPYVYGPLVEYLGLEAPEYCETTIHRWNTKAERVIDFPVRVYFAEVCNTKKAKDGSGEAPNERWSRAPIQMLTKCTEAAGLREAFPDELGGTHTEEELHGATIDVTPEPSRKPETEAPRPVQAADPKAPPPPAEVPVAEFRRLLDVSGIPENEFLEQFGADSLEHFPLDRVSNALAWLDKFAA
ncbi:MAG TPA: phage recombination protein Bet, partial [Steroidobacteraceae bacterium]|nr:phage recombination protein Bet [Steroidobacteraceae bacterium]